MTMNVIPIITPVSSIVDFTEGLAIFVCRKISGCDEELFVLPPFVSVGSLFASSFLVGDSTKSYMRLLQFQLTQTTVFLRGLSASGDLEDDDVAAVDVKFLHYYS